VRPDIVLIDLRLPDLSGIEAMIAIRTEFPDFSVEQIQSKKRERTSLRLISLSISCRPPVCEWRVEHGPWCLLAAFEGLMGCRGLRSGHALCERVKSTLASNNRPAHRIFLSEGP